MRCRSFDPPLMSQSEPVGQRTISINLLLLKDIGVLAKGAGGAAAPPVLKKFGQNAQNSGKMPKIRAKYLMGFFIFRKRKIFFE